MEMAAGVQRRFASAKVFDLRLAQGNARTSHGHAEPSRRLRVAHLLTGREQVKTVELPGFSAIISSPAHGQGGQGPLWNVGKARKAYVAGADSEDVDSEEPEWRP